MLLDTLVDTHGLLIYYCCRGLEKVAMEKLVEYAYKKKLVIVSLVFGFFPWCLVLQHVCIYRLSIILYCFLGTFNSNETLMAFYLYLVLYFLL